MYWPAAWLAVTVTGLVASLVPALMAASGRAQDLDVCEYSVPLLFAEPVWAGLFWYSVSALPMIGISFLSRDMLRKKMW